MPSAHIAGRNTVRRKAFGPRRGLLMRAAFRRADGLRRPRTAPVRVPPDPREPDDGRGPPPRPRGDIRDRTHRGGPGRAVAARRALFRPARARPRRDRGVQTESDLRVEDGIEISLPLWRRLAGGRRYYRWSEIRDVYPRSYEVAGSFLSPFASSAGTLVHTGLGLETHDGGRLLIRFTPGSIRAFRSESQGYIEAMAVIRDRFARRGEPMVRTAKRFSNEQVLELQAHAREPLVPIAGVFLAFFLPPSIVAAVLVTLPGAGFGLTPGVRASPIALALVPPAASMARTLRQSERRNEILSELAKYQEHLREGAGAAESQP